MFPRVCLLSVLVTYTLAQNPPAAMMHMLDPHMVDPIPFDPPPPEPIVKDPLPPVGAPIKLFAKMPPSLKKEECRSLMDLIICLDSSDSIPPPDYAKVRMALSNLMPKLQLGRDMARVGIVVYSSHVAEEPNLVNLTFNRDILQERMKSLIHLRDGTKTSMGIYRMNKMFADHKRGYPVPKVGIVITDGQSKDPPMTRAEAQISRDMGINMFAIGIGYDINRTELNDIASSDAQVKLLNNFGQLEGELDAMMKVVCPCPVPLPIPYSSLKPGERSIGSKQKYICDKGFQGVGDPYIVCDKNANWTPLLFSCQPCQKPMYKIGDAELVTDGYGPDFINTLGTRRTYTCSKGLTSPIPLTSDCVEDINGPVWTPLSGACLQCLEPPYVSNAKLNNLYTGTKIGDLRDYICDKGYIQTGPVKTSCIVDKATGMPGWVEPSEGCIKCDMKMVPYVDNADINVGGEDYVGSVILYSCKDGYVQTGPIQTVCVGDSGRVYWDLPKRGCRACDNPPELPNVRTLAGYSNLVGRGYKYECLDGFQPSGPIEMKCMVKNGMPVWDGPYNSCNGCTAPHMIDNAVIDPKGDTLVGSIRHYRCRDKFIQTGPIEIGCIPGNGGPQWTAAQYECTICGLPPPLNNAYLDQKFGGNQVGDFRHYFCNDGYVHSMVDRTFVTIECIGEMTGKKGKAYWGPPSHICTGCPIDMTPPVDNGYIQPGGNTVGTVRNYICKDGFQSAKDVTVTCLATGDWGPVFGSCSACGAPPKVSNAELLKGGQGPYTLGTVLFYNCLYGYVSIGNTDITCGTGAMWTQPQFQCVKCGVPKDIVNAILQPGETSVGSLRKYVCVHGYMQTGDITTTCTVPDGTFTPDWSTPVHYCKDCGTPHHVAHGTFVAKETTIGKVVHYACDPGFVPSGQTVSYCMNNAEWSIPDFLCLACNEPAKHPANSEWDKQGGLLIDSIRSYTCNNGYVESGPIQIQCVVDKVAGKFPVPYWTSVSDNFCKDCGVPFAAENSDWVKGLTTIGTIAQFVCRAGYVASGKPEVLCNANGEWNKAAFTCIGCTVPPVLPYAYFKNQVPSTVLIGQTVEYMCDSGYYAPGIVTVECLGGAIWSSASYFCTGCDISTLPGLANGKSLIPAGTSDIVQIGTSIQFECFKQHVAVEIPTVTCNSNAQWSQPSIGCELTCFDPPTYKDAYVDIKGGMMVGDVRTYTCNTGHHAVGDMTMTCLSSGLWSDRYFECKVCDIPMDGPFAKVGSYKGVGIGNVVEYVCDAGYMATGPTSVTCVADGPNVYWSKLMIGCSGCINPPVLPFAIISAVLVPGDMVRVGDYVTYTCNNGYYAAGIVQMTCLANFDWQRGKDMCSGCAMIDLPQLPNGFPVAISPKLPDIVEIGTFVTYECSKSHVAVAVPQVECLHDAQWSMPSVGCSLSCFDPPTYKDAYVDIKGGMMVGDVRTYTCNTGHHAVGDMTMTCLSSGLWSDRYFECKVCDVPMDGPFAKVGSYKGVGIGNVVEYVCDAGYMATGPTSVTCVADGPNVYWSKLMIGCSGCINPPVLPFAIISAVLVPGDMVRVGDYVTYTCNNGYYAAGIVQMTCLANFDWQRGKDMCSGCAIIDLPQLPNGFPVAISPKLPDIVEIGTLVTYECSKSHVAVAVPQVECLHNAQWSMPSVGCSLSCFDPPTYKDAYVDIKGGMMVGDVRTYTCNTGHHAVGDMTMTCLSSGLWSQRLFECKVCDIPMDGPFAKVGSYKGVGIGNVVEYICDAGYMATGPTSVTCVADGPNVYWSKLMIGCSGCIDPPKLQFATLQTKIDPVNPMVLVGSEIIYQCNSGYYAAGIVSLQCQSDLLWSKVVNMCTGCLISDVPALPNGVAEFRGKPPSDIVEIGYGVKYVCNKQYVSGKPPATFCLDNAQWSVPTPSCDLTCYDPPLFPDAVVNPFAGFIGEGDVMTYSCLNGYLAVGDMTLTCLASGMWSPRNFDCKVCDKPMNEPFTVLGTYSPLIGGTAEYTCVRGLAPSGPTFITCQAVGNIVQWSKLSIGCSKCKPAPRLEHTFPLQGVPDLVDTVVTYQCLNGYISDGPVTSTCQPDFTWSIPMYLCYDCGPPPNTYQNAYSVYGPTTIGSESRYNCNDGYEMKGKPIITCTPKAIWSSADFLCTVRTTTTTTTPAPKPKDPSVCDGCKFINGAGYMPHPFDCNQYVQCFYSAGGGIESIYMKCAFGLYWDQEDLTCKRSGDVQCHVERCKLDQGLISYKSSDSTKCCAYWECVNGVSEAKCCGEGQSYAAGKGCVHDPSCVADCPFKDELPECNQRPVPDITKYETHIGNGFWVEMPCAPGTGFDMIDCECSLMTNIVPNYVCKPELLMDFDDGEIDDRSGYNIWVNNSGVIPYKGAAYFNGNALISFNRFSNTEFVGTLVVKLRYKEQLVGPTAGQLQALITNGDCDEDPSIVVAKMPGYVLCGVKTTVPKSFALPTVNKPWKEVVYIHNEKKLEGKVCGASYNKYSYGAIHNTHCGIKIGAGTRMPNFKGLMDDISLYQCRPAEELLSVYGGKRFVPQAGGIGPDMIVH